MVKAYLKYELLSSHGVISSPSSNVCLYDGYAISGGLDHVLVWDLRQIKVVSRWYDDSSCLSDRSEVVYIEKCPYSTVIPEVSTNMFAVGYSDGSIRIWRCLKGDKSFKAELVVTLRGHNSSITKLAFCSPGALEKGSNILASGSKDGDIVIWDLVAETGVCKLKGHRDSITGLLFPASCSSRLFSSSRDNLIKIWDLSLSHCIETNADMPDVGAIQFTQGNAFLIAGSSDPHIHMFSVDQKQLEMDIKLRTGTILKHYAIVPRKGRERIQDIAIDVHGMSHFIVHSCDKFLEIFKIKTMEEINRLLRNKTKKGKAAMIGPGEEIESIGLLRADGKIRSISMDTDRPCVLLSFFDNRLSYCEYDPQKSENYRYIHNINNNGHHSDIKMVMFSHCCNYVFTLSRDQLKIWNINTGLLVRSFDAESDEFSCGTFSSNDQNLFIGTRQGHLVCLDIPSGTTTNIRNAHQGKGGINCITTHPENRNLVITGGCDKKVKFWRIFCGDNTSMESIQTMEFVEEISLIKYSPNAKLICIALLDCTVQVFNTIVTTSSIESKFFLSLYGHKLPITSMDVSSDSSLIVTASSDKNIKIWGLDFGDCHKSIFGHDEAVLSVAFVPNTHYFFTGSRDRTIKYWDGDNFQCISRLSGHFGDVWSLCTSANGSLLISVGSDKSICVWRRTREQIFLGEERERELEEQIESEFGEKIDKKTMRSSERVFEILELVNEEYDAMELQKSSGMNNIARNSLLSAYAGKGNEDKPAEWILMHAIGKMQATELDHFVLTLPVRSFFPLLRTIQQYILLADCCNGVLLGTRVLTILLRSHGDELIQDPRARILLSNISERSKSEISKQRDDFGMNLTILKRLYSTCRSEKESIFG